MNLRFAFRLHFVAAAVIPMLVVGEGKAISDRDATSILNYGDGAADAAASQPRRHTKKGTKSSQDGGSSTQLPATLVEKYEFLLKAGGGMEEIEAMKFALQVTDLSDSALTSPFEAYVLDEASGLCFTGTAAEVNVKCGGKLCCVGAGACDWIRQATVCLGSCMGQDSCGTLRPGSIILPFSCTGEAACNNIGGRFGDGPGSQLRVGPKACIGENACYTIGENGNNKVLVKENACVGEAACDYVGNSAEISVIIENYACRGENACYELGENTEETIFIGAKSCNGTNACYDLGEGAEQFISISATTCIGEESCYRLAHNGSPTSVQLGSNSCMGDSACNGLAYESDDTVSVGSNSCTGKKACVNTGREVADSVSIGSNSCQGIEACYHVARSDSDDGEIESLAVGANACIGDEICYEFGKLMPGGGKVVIDAEACADAGDVCGTKTAGGEKCDANHCAADQTFQMVVPEASCDGLCTGP